MIPAAIAAIVIAAAVAIAVAIWLALSTAAKRTDLPPAARRKVRIGSAVFFGAWLGAVLLLAPGPASLLTPGDPFRIVPLVPLAFVVSTGTALFVVLRSSSLRRVLAAVPLPVLNALQAWRVLGVVFVVLLAQGHLPAHFALPAGWGDIAVGVTAPLVALALARGIRGAVPLAVFWNLFGLVDLAVAVGMGTGILAPLVIPELGPRVPPAAAMGALPMILVPTFAVPASVMVHGFALARLRRELGPAVRLEAASARPAR